MDILVWTQSKITIKYVPTALPANANPSYDISENHINHKYLKENPWGDLSVALAKTVEELEDNL